MATTPLREIDEALRKLDAKKDVWQCVSCSERGSLLTECLNTLLEVSRDAAKAATDAHGSYGSGIGEEQYLHTTLPESDPSVCSSFWVPVALALVEYREAMRANGQPSPVSMRQQNGQFIADVFPKGTLFGDSKFEVWIQRGHEPTQGAVYRRKQSSDFKPTGHIALVLGAGNHVNVVVLDILHKLFCDDDVVIIKMNPQNAFLGVYVERTLQPFFDAGYVHLVYGGASEGQYLCQHTLVDNIHLTGSNQTFNQIVFDTPTPTEASKRVLEKEVTAELGCVTPAIVVPGNWTEDEMVYVANTIVAGLTSNSSHSCCALECLIMMESWPQRSQFLTILKERLNQKERQVAWYRGSQAKFDKFLKQFPKAAQLGQSSTQEPGDTHPWLFAEGLSPERANTTEENWCGVLQEVVLDGAMDQIPQFLESAAAFCNDRCRGSLSCTLIVDPTTQNQHPSAFEAALSALKYGTITVNAPPVYSFLPAATWGAYPGNPVWDVGSGNCTVHNTSLFDYPEKTVCYAPWQLQPIAIWADISNKEAIMGALIQFVTDSGVLNLLQLVRAALRAEY